MTQTPILNTRPEPQASRFARDLAEAFGAAVRVVATPLMRTEFLPLAPPEGLFAALVLTSETGAEAAARLRKAGAALPGLAWCVGDRTADAAAERGFSAISAGGDAGDLLRLIRAQPGEGRLLYLHGEDRAADLTAGLAPRPVVSLTAYRQAAAGLSNEAAGLLAGGGRVIVPLFSPRSVRLFLAAADGLDLTGVVPVVISENARAALPPGLAGGALVAARPDGPSMMAAIGRCFPQASP